MASNRIGTGLVMVVLVTVLWTGGVTAQTSSCRNVITGLAPCLNYITGNSSSPSSSCCSELSNVVQSQPQCLCWALNNGAVAAALGLAINRTLALGLPNVCNVQTPPLSRCNAAAPTISPTTTPMVSPADSPADSSNQTPDLNISPTASDIPAGSGGSKTVPTTTGGDASDGNITKLSLNFNVFLIFIASYALSTLTSF